MKNMIVRLAFAAALGSPLVCFQSVLAQGTAFTYQGQLSASGSPASGNYDFTFALFNNSSTNTGQVGATLTNLDVGVTNGLFTVALDFGSNFPGASRWLAIGVRTNGGSGFTGLSPLQELTPTPYAIYAANAGSATTATFATAAMTAASATNLSGTLAGDVTGVQSATVVASVGGQTAANVATGVIAASSATSNNITGAIVTRGNGGNFSAGTVTLSGSLVLPNLPATIYSGNYLLLEADANQNFFAGPQAGNQTISGLYNVGIGSGALANDTMGGDNTALGFEALYYNTNGENTAIGFAALLENTIGGANTALGYEALFDNSTGNCNTACGTETMINNTSGSYNTTMGIDSLEHNMAGSTNTASGAFALGQNTTGSYNTATGAYALEENVIGNSNTACGYAAMVANTNGSFNTACGDGALFSNTSGSSNIALGHQAGYDLTTGGNNIDIGNLGNAGEANTIRIGTPGIQTQTFLTGNVGIGVSSPAWALDAAAPQAVGQFTSANGSPAVLVLQSTNSGTVNDGAINFAGPGGSFGQILYSAANVMTFKANGANMTFNGTTLVVNGISYTSDRHVKSGFAALNPQDILARVAALPVSSWVYTNNISARHIGPMAQDFHAAFATGGDDDKHINVGDEGGVALAAIQGLNQKVEQAQAESKAKDAEIQELKQSVDELKKMVQLLVAGTK